MGVLEFPARRAIDIASESLQRLLIFRGQFDAFSTVVLIPICVCRNCDFFSPFLIIKIIIWLVQKVIVIFEGVFDCWIYRDLKLNIIWYQILIHHLNFKREKIY